VGGGGGTRALAREHSRTPRFSVRVALMRARCSASLIISRLSEAARQISRPGSLAGDAMSDRCPGTRIFTIARNVFRASFITRRYLPASGAFISIAEGGGFTAEWKSQRRDRVLRSAFADWSEIIVRPHPRPPRPPEMRLITAAREMRAALSDRAIASYALDDLLTRR